KRHLGTNFNGVTLSGPRDYRYSDFHVLDAYYIITSFEFPYIDNFSQYKFKLATYSSIPANKRV
ncbi:hypothetical protein C6Y10_01425, partial [Lactiplantibacillus pentosus]|uniref:hypothetical protein n=1 Tax=Lactiplantibacillus pentosus TaxID=1589 RepID=UPI000D4AC331